MVSIQAFSAGLAASGAITSAIRFICKASFPNTKSGLRKSARKFLYPIPSQLVPVFGAFFLQLQSDYPTVIFLLVVIHLIFCGSGKHDTAIGETDLVQVLVSLHRVFDW
jgi:hypothetical protein